MPEPNKELNNNHQQQAASSKQSAAWYSHADTAQVWFATTAAPFLLLGSAGSQCVVYPQRIRIYRPQTGHYQAVGRLAQAATVGRSPSEHSLPAEGWSVYGRFVLLLIDGCTL